MYDSYYSTLILYISMQPVQTDKPVQTDELARIDGPVRPVRSLIRTGPDRLE